jgi:hypothetical protein
MVLWAGSGRECVGDIRRGGCETDSSIAVARRRSDIWRSFSYGKYYGARLMIRTKFATPAAGEYSAFYDTYIRRFAPENFLAACEQQIADLRQLLADLPAGEDSRPHEPYTWTLKQLTGHLIDCERIFSTRLLRIAASDNTPNPGFDQNWYVDHLDYRDVSMEALLDEFEHLRRANLLLARRLTPESLVNTGTADDQPVSARANLYILAGHLDYHLEIIRRRLGRDL